LLSTKEHEPSTSERAGTSTDCVGAVGLIRHEIFTG